MRSAFLTVLIFLAFLTSSKSIAGDFDCNRVKVWPDYSGSTSSWAVKYCEKILKGSLYDIKSALVDIERYQQHRQVTKGAIAFRFEELLIQASKIPQKHRANLKEWRSSLRDLHQKVSNTLMYNPQLCATSWECNTVFFGTTDNATLCGDSCNGKQFRLKEENLIPLLETVIAGMITKTSSDKILALGQKIYEIKNDKEASEVAMADADKDLEIFMNAQVRPNTILLMEEYDRAFQPSVILP